MAMDRDFSIANERRQARDERARKVWEIRFWNGMGLGLCADAAAARATAAAQKKAV